MITLLVWGLGIVFVLAAAVALAAACRKQIGGPCRHQGLLEIHDITWVDATGGYSVQYTCDNCGKTTYRGIWLDK